MKRQDCLSGHHTRCDTLPFEQFHCFLVKGHEGLAAKPSSFKGDNAIRKISAGIENGQPSLNGRPVGNDITHIDKSTDRV